VAQGKTRNKIIDSLMALAAEQPWGEVTMEALAERAGVTLAALRAAYDGRLAIVADFTRRIDERVLEGIDPGMAGEGPRERLFDILFSRFEQLAPYRPAIRNLARAARRDPCLALALNRNVAGSMAWMLTAAGIRANGGRGVFRAQGLALVWARVMHVWLDDEDPGLARTMAELDKRLRRAERVVIRIDRLERLACCVRGGRRSGSSPVVDAGIAEGHPT
jgi:AcrR family transcriptional regulator